jgi:hypothetical protein
VGNPPPAAPTPVTTPGASPYIYTHYCIRICVGTRDFGRGSEPSALEIRD